MKLQHKVVNNTGLEVNQGAAAVISNGHLAVQVNVDQAVEILYDVTELPHYGQLQRLHSSGEWKLTNVFSQKLLNKERIRYVSSYRGLQPHSNATDSFRCNVSVGARASEQVVFTIVVHWIHFKVTRSKMEVSGTQRVTLTTSHLHVVTKGVQLSDADVFFRLMNKPKRGQLLLVHDILQRNSTFSQKNVTDGAVKYELLSRIHKDTRDTVSFQVYSLLACCARSDFRIHVKGEWSVVTMVNQGLSLLEGGSKVLSKDVLFSHSVGNHQVQYVISERPRHGHLHWVDWSDSSASSHLVDTFTNQEILEERIMYVHDDSETKQDSFTVLLTSHKPSRNVTELTVNVSIQLVNDQRPVRVVDKVFHVAREGQRLLTLSDLRFHDDDSDFEDGWLVYMRRGIPMGELVLASDTSHRLYEFSQRDLEQVICSGTLAARGPPVSKCSGCFGVDVCDISPRRRRCCLSTEASALGGSCCS